MFSILFKTLTSLQKPKTKKAAIYTLVLSIIAIVSVIAFPDYFLGASILIAFFAALYKFLEFSFHSLFNSIKFLRNGV